MRIIQTLYGDAQTIIKRSTEANLPEVLVRNALKKFKFTEEGDVYVIAAGFAAWTMANAAYCALGFRLKKGIAITKYKYSKGEIPNMEIFEADHSFTDENGLSASRRALEMLKDLRRKDDILLLLSGGADMLFEQYLEGISTENIRNLNKDMSVQGANDSETNVIMERLSALKGGRFAKRFSSSKIFSVILSDISNDASMDMPSSIVAPSKTTAQEALDIMNKYGVKPGDAIVKAVKTQTEKTVDNLIASEIGDINVLCEKAAETASGLVYSPIIWTTSLKCSASAAGSFTASIAKQVGKNKFSFQRPRAFIFGGRTKINLEGDKKSGQSQELALAAAQGIEGMQNAVIFSFDSSGFDGNTNAAGAIVDGTTIGKLKAKGINISAFADKNGAYETLKRINALITTGATGTNSGAMTVALIG
jgi:hydroxypyruvate reductase